MRDFFAGIGFVIAGIVTIITAQQFPTLPSLQYGPSLFPSLAGSLPEKTNWAMLLPPISIVFYILASDYLGAMLTIMIIMLLLMLLRKTSPYIALATSLAVSSAIYFIFSRYLLVPLPQGLLLGGSLPWIS